LPNDLIKLDDFLDSSDLDVFTIGRSPIAIDIMTKVKGLDFENTFEKSQIHETEGIEIRLIHIQNLFTAKHSAGRLKDLYDIKKLKEE